MFREGSRLRDAETIEEDVEMARRVMAKIESGEYPPFPMIHANHMYDNGTLEAYSHRTGRH